MKIKQHSCAGEDKIWILLFRKKKDDARAGLCLSREMEIEKEKERERSRKKEENDCPGFTLRESMNE